MATFFSLLLLAFFLAIIFYCLKIPTWITNYAIISIVTIWRECLMYILINNSNHIHTTEEKEKKRNLIPGLLSTSFIINTVNDAILWLQNRTKHLRIYLIYADSIIVFFCFKLTENEPNH